MGKQSEIMTSLVLFCCSSTNNKNKCKYCIHICIGAGTTTWSLMRFLFVPGLQTAAKSMPKHLLPQLSICESNPIPRAPGLAMVISALPQAPQERAKAEAEAEAKGRNWYIHIYIYVYVGKPQAVIFKLCTSSGPSWEGGTRAEADAKRRYL